MSPNNTLIQWVTIDHASIKSLGQISAWESGLLYIEIIDIETGSRLLIEHHELNADIDLKINLRKCIEIMISGNV